MLQVTAELPAAQDALSEIINSGASLYSLPDIYFRVRDIINDPESEMSQLSDVLVNDPGLSARLLRIANSPLFGLAATIDTITRAVQVIGFQHIYDLVIATSITKAFQGVSNNVMSMDTFWMASIERALIARKLAEHIGIWDSERLFVGGLLLDIGHLVLYEHKPEEAQNAIIMAEQQGKPLYLAEREILGFSAAELASALAQEWSLPEQFSNLILYQDCPELAEENQLESIIVHTAKQLAGTVPEPEAIQIAYDTIPATSKTALNLSLEDLEQLVSDALSGISETLGLILPQS
jgi:HD-like signal output (HDOD) protein